ncbi:MAG TPA: SRPBCC family protein [Marmoricola sp.]|nr:SRPBCC family protein [Marmoricola sp.]
MDGAGARDRRLTHQGVLTPAAHYQFVHTCVVEAPLEQVHGVLVDLEHYPDWWPQVRAVASLGPDTALVVCRSVLPYDLELVLDAVSREMTFLEVRISGPIAGGASWTLQHDPIGTSMTYRQEVVASGPLAVASYLIKPMLRWNHATMMRGFERGIAKAATRAVE